MDFVAQRSKMVDLQLARRGVKNPRVLEAFRKVPREQFVPEDLKEFAYEDAPLPIQNGQTISQPYVVAATVEALSPRAHELVLDVGTGSGYAAAILAELAREVCTVERVHSLAELARERLARLGYQNVRVLCADGTQGWPEHAPFDGIAVAAGGPEVPRALLEQLAPQGRLVMPVGPEDRQVLTRVTRRGQTHVAREELMDVRFVPLIGERGWPEAEPILQAPGGSRKIPTIAKLVRETAESVSEIENAPIDALLERIGSARLVLLGESTHGTSEFYRMRARITKELIDKRGFSFVAVEADWPDAAQIDNYVMGDPLCSEHDFTPFSRFPTWMWRNEEVSTFVEWLRARNLAEPDRHRRAGFHGLDLYSLFSSIGAVLSYLDRVDPNAARVARGRYGSLTPWQKDPSAYGRAVLVGKYQSSEEEVVSILSDLLRRRLEYARRDGERFFDATQNATVVVDAERYYRAMYYGSATSWNLRDTHMFQTLKSILGFYGTNSRGVVWAHNSHVGNALFTEMSARGEHNLGQLCQTEWGDAAYVIGFGTDHGTVAAASNWDEPVQRFRLRPSHAESYERIFHDADVPAFFLPLRYPRRRALRDELSPPRLERAIGVVFRPETERQSHYFYATLPRQFDELIWFDESQAVSSLSTRSGRGADLPDTFPFGF